MNGRLSEAGLRATLKRACDAAGGVPQWAALHGMSDQTVYHVLNSKRMAGATVLRALGLRRCPVTYEGIRNEPVLVLTATPDTLSAQLRAYTR